MHTAGSAYQLRMDRLTGTLTPGRAADLVLLDRDVTRVPVREISDTKVRLTMVGGRVTHDAGSSSVKGAAATTPAIARPARLAGGHGRHDACGCEGKATHGRDHAARPSDSPTASVPGPVGEDRAEGVAQEEQLVVGEQDADRVASACCSGVEPQVTGALCPTPR